MAQVMACPPGQCAPIRRVMGRGSEQEGRDQAQMYELRGQGGGGGPCHEDIRGQTGEAVHVAAHGSGYLRPITLVGRGLFQQALLARGHPAPDCRPPSCPPAPPPVSASEPNAGPQSTPARRSHPPRGCSESRTPLCAPEDSAGASSERAADARDGCCTNAHQHKQLPL